MLRRRGGRHHLPTKEALGAALARPYSQGAQALFELLGRKVRSGVLLRRYIVTFRLALASGNRMRLCGVMGAEYDALPEAVKIEIGMFADMNEACLTKVLEGSIDQKGGSARHRAFAIYAAMLGAQIVARSRNDISLFDRAISCYRTTGLLPQEMQA
jgi:TetR/AcrR family transcriptional regulator, transcriptional repressor for nem operon